MQKGIYSQPAQAESLFFPRKESTLARWQPAKRQRIAIGEMMERRCISRRICTCAGSKQKREERSSRSQANQTRPKNRSVVREIYAREKIVERKARRQQGLAEGRKD